MLAVLSLQMEKARRIPAAHMEKVELWILL